MAISSGLYGPWLRDMGTNAKAFALNASDVITYQTTSDAYTPNFDTHDEEADLTNEVTGTGYTTGGETLGSPTWTIASGFAILDGSDVSLSTTTLASVEGFVLYDNTIAGDPLLGLVDFGAPYSTTAGTFAVTWSASGILRIDYIP